VRGNPSRTKLGKNQWHVSLRFTCGHEWHIPVLAGFVGLQLVLNHTDHNVITDETSGVHDFLCLDTEFCLGRYLFTQHVTCSQVADAEGVTDEGSLGTLAYTVEKAELVRLAMA
jgi:hypothetical protein